MKSRNSPKLGLLGRLGLLAQLGVAAATPSATPDGVVHMGFQRRDAVDGSPIQRRANSPSGTVVQALQNEVSQGAYMIDIKVGTPPQTLTLQLDTGSSDAWMVYTGADICKKGQCTYGSFEPEKSSTFVDLAKGIFKIAYVDKTSSNGDYFNDVFSLGGATVQNLTMGIGIDTDIPFGLLGVGFPVNEAGVASGVIKSYPNLPVQMAAEGFTKTVAFSMWLNDLESSTGSLLFGGVDSGKYQGPLTRLKLYPTKDPKAVNEFAVALTSVTAVSKSGTDKLGSSSFPAAVVLDAGATLSFLPPDLANQMYKEVSATVDEATGKAAVPCSYTSAGGYFAFGFGGAGGAVVNVSMSELVLGAVGNYTSGPNKGQTACRFGIVPASEGATLILGDTFLRSAYVVYDLINSEVALAQTKPNATDSNVSAFASLSATAPGATLAPNQASIAQGVVTATPTSFAAAASFTATATSGASRSAGVALAALLSVGLGVVTFLV